jgi:UDP-sugar transporter A1/2/3
MIDIFKIFSVKYAALALLVLQNTFLVIYMHYSRTNHEGKLYASSTAVLLMEIVKFVCCILVITLEKKSILGLYAALNDEVIKQPIELLKLSVPSILYTIQNNLLYFALSHLDAATFQVGYQVKIITTALFSVLMLGRTLSSWQWISLFLLTIGVSLAQLSAANNNNNQNTLMGIVAVLFAAITSGFSGVYFEKILKNSGTSLWMRNIQMGISSVIAAVLGIYFSGELPQVRESGFFFGYNSIVIAVILLQAIGGLIVAVVVKYADNILKGFAASFSIVTSCILSYFFFDFKPNFEFLVGATLVNISMYLYSNSPTSRKDEKDEKVDKPRREGTGDNLAKV